MSNLQSRVTGLERSGLGPTPGRVIEYSRPDLAYPTWADRDTQAELLRIRRRGNGSRPRRFWTDNQHPGLYFEGAKRSAPGVLEDLGIDTRRAWTRDELDRLAEGGEWCILFDEGPRYRGPGWDTD